MSNSVPDSQSGQTLSTDAATPSPPKRRLSRWIVWLALGGMLIGAGVAFRSFWLVRPVGAGPAGPHVSRAPFEHAWTQRKVLVLGLGDSVTAGFGAKKPSHTFFNRLTRNPPDEFPEMQGLCLSAVLPNMETDNIAVSGTTSLSHLDTIRDHLPHQDSKTFGVIVMTTGGNDLIHWYGRKPPREGAMYGATLQQAEPWIRSFRKRLGQMLDLIDERFPGGCQIFLADIYDPTDGVGDAPSAYLPAWAEGLAIHTAYNKVIHDVARERANVHLVRLRDTFLGHGTHCRQFWRSTYCRTDPTYWFYRNIEDPNDRGHDAARRAFLIEIARVLPGALQKQP